MGHEQRARELEIERQAGLPTEPREIAVEAAPSEWLEQQARNFLSGLVEQAAGVQELMQPRSPVLGPGGQPVSQPRVDPFAVVLENQRRMMMGVAMVLDVLLTQLTGRPELQPVRKAGGNGEVPMPGPVKEA